MQVDEAKENKLAIKSLEANVEKEKMEAKAMYASLALDVELKDTQLMSKQKANLGL